MAETTETADLQEVSDSDLFKSATEAPKEETPAQAAERERDDKGRFVKAKSEEAPVEEKPAAEPAAPAQTEAPPEAKDEGGQVPSWRLREVREAREAAEARATQEAQRSYQMAAELQAMRDQLQKLQQPKAEPVDFFADPDKALQQHLTPIEQRFAKLEQDMRLATSRTAAIAEHGAKSVAEMEQAIADAMSKNHPDMQGLAMQMRSSDDPAGVAMQWYRRTKLWDVTGGDPDAYKQKVLDEALKDPKYLEKALEHARNVAGATGSRPLVNLPPSLSKAAGSGATMSSDDGDMSDRALFKHAMTK